MTDRVWELREIARRLCVAEEETVLAYARRWRDPLRLHRRLGRYWMLASRIDAWRQRQQPGNMCQRVRTLDGIGGKIGRSIMTVKAYARRAYDPLPVQWDADGAWAYVDAIRDWYQAQDELVRSSGSVSLAADDAQGLITRPSGWSIPVPLAVEKG